MPRDADLILTGQTTRIASVTPNRIPAYISRVVLTLTFILITAGALVTGNKAALSDPDWPLFVGGQLVPTPETWVGGLRFEDSHRVIAATTGIATLIMAIAVTMMDRRKNVRILAWTAVGTVIIQALLGGGIILSHRNPIYSVVHACVAQAFLALVASTVVMTSRRWERETDQIDRTGNSSILREFKIAIGLVYFQLIIGAGVRHSETAFLPHLLIHVGFAVSIVMMSLWLGLRVFKEYGDFKILRRGIQLIFGLLTLQVVMGIMSIFANRSRLEPEVPYGHHIGVSTTHVVNGALILVVFVAMTLFAHRRLLSPRHRNPDTGSQVVHTS